MPFHCIDGHDFWPTVPVAGYLALILFFMPCQYSNKDDVQNKWPKLTMKIGLASMYFNHLAFDMSVRVIAEMEKTKNRIETIQGVQYSVRNQTLIKRVSAFLFHYCFSQPPSWQKSSFAVNKTFINKIRSKLGAVIDPSEVRRGKQGEGGRGSDNDKEFLDDATYSWQPI